jgi:hypothetical protein
MPGGGLFLPLGALDHFTVPPIFVQMQSCECTHFAPFFVKTSTKPMPWWIMSFHHTVPVRTVFVFVAGIAFPPLE